MKRWKKQGVTIHPDDYDILQLFYEQTNGDNWNNNSGWEFYLSPDQVLASEVDSWYGVGVDRQSGRVTYLMLEDNQLSGNIPPEIGRLENLTILELRQNKLSGNIPPEIGNLKQLELLDIHENNLSGQIPPEIANLLELEYLHLNYNNLEGNTPKAIIKLPKLVWVTIDSTNSFEGDIKPTNPGLCIEIFDLACAS